MKTIANRIQIVSPRQGLTGRPELYVGLLRLHQPTQGMCESGFPAGHFERVVVNESQKSMCHHPLRQSEDETCGAAMS